MKKATWAPGAVNSLHVSNGLRALPSLRGVDTGLSTAAEPAGAAVLWPRGSAPCMASLRLAEPRHCSDVATVFQLITDCVLVWNNSGTILEANAPCERLLGYSADGLRGAACADVVGDITHGRARLQHAYGDRKDCAIEVRRIAHPAHGEITIAVIRPHHPSAGFNTVQGISRHVVERVTDVIFQIDITGRWVFANQVSVNHRLGDRKHVPEVRFCFHAQRSGDRGNALTKPV